MQDSQPIWKTGRTPGSYSQTGQAFSITLAVAAWSATGLPDEGIGDSSNAS